MHIYHFSDLLFTKDAVRVEEEPAEFNVQFNKFIEVVVLSYEVSDLISDAFQVVSGVSQSPLIDLIESLILCLFKKYHAFRELLVDQEIPDVFAFIRRLDQILHIRVPADLVWLLWLALPVCE